VEPSVELGRDPRADGAELIQGAAGMGELIRLFRPEPRSPRGALQRPPPMAGLVPRGHPQELADVGVRQHPSGNPVTRPPCARGSGARPPGKPPPYDGRSLRWASS